MYEYLYKCIKNDILQANIRPGEKLPSKRSFAKNLGISVITVENAYEQLIAEGYIYSIPKRGFYVTDFRTSMEIEKKKFTREMLPLTEGTSGYLADFASNQTQSELFPFTIWTKIVREVLNSNQMQLMTNPPCGGILPLREAIATYLKEFRGMTVLPEQIVIGAGTEVLVSALVALIGRERLFAVEDPGYSRVRRILVVSGARIAPTPLSGGAIDVRELYRSGAGAAYVTPTHQFPTGEEMQPGQREALLRWARETGGYILEDDYDSEFRFSGAGAPALRAMDGGRQVVYMNTFSRTLAPGLRLSFMVLPEELAARYRTMHAACTVPGFEQETLRKFIAGGFLERHIARMRVIYRARLAALTEAVQTLNLGDIAPCGAGLYALLRVGGKAPARELAPLAEQAGVYLTRLSDYAVMQNDESRVVLLGFSGMDEEQIRQGLSALKRAWG
mgnify:CR=1 FL=1